MIMLIGLYLLWYVVNGVWVYHSGAAAAYLGAADT